MKKKNEEEIKGWLVLTIMAIFLMVYNAFMNRFPDWIGIYSILEVGIVYLKEEG